MSARLPLCLLAIAFFCANAPARSQTNLPEGDGKEILQTACAGCHDLARVFRAGYSERDWQTILRMMRNVGALVARPNKHLTKATTLSEIHCSGTCSGVRQRETEDARVECGARS
jgi:hypothetical protein